MGVFYPQCMATLHVVFDGFGGADSQSTMIRVRPRAATVHLNGYREADTFELDFDASYLPFSPELIRSMGVEIYMFQTTGLQQQVDQTTFNDFRNEETLAVSGLVDDGHYHVGNDGRSFRVSGRDYTALMLDKQWDPQKRVPTDIPLDQVVQQLVDEASGAATTGRILTVKTVGADGSAFEAPELAPMNQKESSLISSGKFQVSKKGKIKIPTAGKGHHNTNKKGVPVKGGSNYWDVIYRLCIRHGFIVFVRGSEVIISKPQTLTEATLGRARSLQYGRDLATLDISRKMGKETVPQIQCVCYDPIHLRQITAKFPDPVTQKTTAIGTKKDEVRLVVVDGIHDPGMLLDLAKTYYNNLARAEGSIRFTTKSLKDFRNNDLLFLRPGDPVQIAFDSINDKEFRELSIAQRVQRLISPPFQYKQQIAELIANEYAKIERFKKAYYAKDVILSWSNDQGMSIDVTALNYISSGRDDKS